MTESATVGKAAELLGVSKTEVRRLCARGVLQYEPREDGQWRRVTMESIIACLTAQEEGITLERATALRAAALEALGPYRDVPGVDAFLDSLAELHERLRRAELGRVIEELQNGPQSLR